MVLNFTHWAFNRKALETSVEVYALLPPELRQHHCISGISVALFAVCVLPCDKVVGQPQLHGVPVNVGRNKQQTFIGTERRQVG